VIFDTCEAGALARKPFHDGGSVEDLLFQGNQAWNIEGNAEVPVTRSSAQPAVAQSSGPTLFSEGELCQCCFNAE
jgi:hypothetical protein